MAFPALLPTPKPPAPLPSDEFPNIENLDRPELDDMPDTDRDPVPTLPSLDWENDESGVSIKRRA
jgi:hypothetical protein